MIALLLSCASDETGLALCSGGVLLGSVCEDFSTDEPRAPHELDGGFPSSGLADEDASGNWLADPGFEEGVLATPWDPAATPPDWTASGAPSWLRTGGGLEAGDARSGQAVVELADGDVLQQAVARLLTFDDRYVVRAWTRADTTADAEVSIQFLDGANAVLSESTFPITAWPDWRVHSLGAVGPEAVQLVAAAVRGTGDAPVWFDDIRLELASTDPVTFDLSAPTHPFEGFGAQVSPYAADAEVLSTTSEALGLRFVRIDPALATADDLAAVRAATGQAPWLLTAASVPSDFTDGAGALTDVGGFAAYWASRAQALDALGIEPEAVELVDDPSGIDDETYASLVDATRKALDGMHLTGVAIAGPGTRTLLGDHEARDRVLALGSEARIGAWSFQAGDDGTICTGGSECLSMGWDDVLGALDAIGGAGGRPLWVTHLATAELTFLGETWPSPDASSELNVTASAAYAVRVVENALVGIASGALRAYFWYAVDDAWGFVETGGAKKPIYGAIAVLAPIAAGADVVPSPDQTGRATYVATFATGDEIVVVATNEEAAHQPIEILLEGASGKETVASSKAFARYLSGDPENGVADTSGTYDVSIEARNADGEITIEADLLPVSVTVLVFDRGT